jgi:hypothetical protein
LSFIPFNDSMMIHLEEIGMTWSGQWKNNQILILI